MDGVLADFERGVRELCGVMPVAQGMNCPEEELMWDRIREIGNFYDRLELMPGAGEMFAALYGKYGSACEILTGVPKPDRRIVSAGADKTRWVRRLLSKDIVINAVLRRDKYMFCTGPDCILIDDYEKNIREWENSGGTGVLSTDAAQTMERLKNMGIL